MATLIPGYPFPSSCILPFPSSLTKEKTVLPVPAPGAVIVQGAGALQDRACHFVGVGDYTYLSPG
jgi:hypothetical protein